MLHNNNINNNNINNNNTIKRFLKKNYTAAANERHEKELERLKLTTLPHGENVDTGSCTWRR